MYQEKYQNIMKKDILKNSPGTFEKKVSIKPSEKKKNPVKNRFRKSTKNDNADSGNQTLQHNNTDSAVAIPISSVSHHRQIKKIHSSSLEILVAEDNEVSFLILKSQLEKLNVKIHHAKDGLEAVEMVKSIPNIGLVLLDVKMPLMDGIEAIRKIRQITSETPVIAQSAFADDIDILSLYQAGCDDFISKPIDQSLLLSKIRLWNF